MGRYYFEVEVLDSMESCGLCIGFCGECVLHQSMPGSYHRSSAYYANGSLRKNTRRFDYGNEYNKGDIVGCGIDWGNFLFFFTLNGRQLGTMRYHTLRHRIYPVVGFCGRKVVRISARFAGPFKYNWGAVQAAHLGTCTYTPVPSPRPSYGAGSRAWRKINPSTPSVQTSGYIYGSS